MKLRQRIANLISGAKLLSASDAVHRTQLDETQWYSSNFSRPYDYDECYRAYETVAAVKMLVDIPAYTLAQVPLRVYRRLPKSSDGFRSKRLGGTDLAALRRRGKSRSVKAALAVSGDHIEEIEDEAHPYVSLLNKWNDRDDGFSGMFKIVQHIGISGGVVLVPIGGGVPDQLEIVNPKYVRPVANPDSGRLIESYAGHRHGRDQWDADWSEVIPIGFEDPDDPTRFLGWLKPSMRLVALMYHMEVSRQAFFENGGRPGVVIKGAKTKDNIDSVLAHWQMRFSDSRKAHTPLVLQGDMEAILDNTAKDIDFIAGYQQVLESLSMAAMVPMTLLQQQNANLAGAVNASPVFAEINLGPKARLIEDKLNERLSPLFGDDLFVAFDDLIGSDRLAESQRIQIEVGGPWKTPNEARSEEGREPIEGGDVLVSVAPAGAGFGLVAPGQSFLDRLPAEPEPVIRDVTVERSLSDSDVKRIAEAVSGMIPKAVEIPAALNQAPDPEPEPVKVYTYADFAYLAEPVPGCGCDCGKPPRGFKNADASDEIARIEREAADWYERTYGDALALLERSGQLTRGQALAFIQEAGNELIEAISEPLVEQFASGYRRGGEDLPPESVDVTVVSDRAGELYRQYRISGGAEIAETLLTDAAAKRDAIIEQGLDDGLRADEIAKLLEEKVPDLARSRAEMIARTEVANAQNMGRLEAWRDSGIVTGKEYSLSSNPCPICVGVARKWQGKTAGIDEPFLKAGESISLGNGKVYTPGRNIMVTPTHPYCECGINSVLDGVEFNDE